MRVSNPFSAIGALFALCLTASAASAAKLSPLGVWIDHNGRGAVEIKPCGKRLCGYVVWTRSKKDKKKGCRKKIISGLQKVSSRTWDNGRIYSPERGSTYDLEVKPLSANKIRILGYAGSKIFSKTMYWTRAPKDLVRCDRPAAKPDQPIVAKAKPKTPSKPKIKTATVTPKKKKAAQPKKKATAPTKTAAIEPTISPPKPKAVERPAPTKTDEAKLADRKPATAPTTDEPVESTDETASADLSADDDDIVENDQPRKRKRVARYKSKKRCSFKAPFVTISFPCKK